MNTRTSRLFYSAVAAAVLAAVATLPIANAIPVFPGDSMHFDDGSSGDLKRIEQLIRDNQLDDALKSVAVLEKQYPNNASTYNIKGAVYLRKGDRYNARSNFERAMGLSKLYIPAALNLAQMELEDGNPQAARRWFQPILSSDNKNVDAMLGMAGVAAATQQDDEYEMWLKRIVEAAPSALPPRIMLGNFYLQKKDGVAAMAVATQAQRASPDNEQVLDLLGSAQLATNGTDAALATYARLVELYPRDPMAHYKLAVAQMTAGKPDLAATSLDDTLKLKPKDRDAKILLALARLRTGKSDEALVLARQVQDENPKSSLGWTLQGDVLMAQKQYVQAIAAYEAATRIEKTGPLAIKMYQASSANGDSAAGESRVLDWLRDHGNDLTVRFFMANLYSESGRTKQAIEQYQRILAVDYRNVRALNDVAWLYYVDKDSRALATAEQAYRLKPGSPEVLDTLGWILSEQGKSARATKLLQEAVANAPNSPVIRYHWAAALAKSGDKSGARKELEVLLAGDKAFPQRREAEALFQRL